MTQLAMQGSMHELTATSLRRALFESGEFELEVASEFNDEGIDWADKANLVQQRKMETNEPLAWDGNGTAEGILWGGCVESLVAQAAANIYLPTNEGVAETVLFLETAEDIPDHWIIEYLLTGFGERGWLERFQAVIVGRPKAWEFDKPHTPEEKVAYRQQQRETVVKTVRTYNRQIPIVQNLDFGHTDPQHVLPNGNRIRIDGNQQKIWLSY